MKSFKPGYYYWEVNGNLKSEDSFFIVYPDGTYDHYLGGLGPYEWYASSDFGWSYRHRNATYLGPL